MKGLVGEGVTGDVSAALSRLNFGVEDLNRQLKAEVRRDSPFSHNQRSPSSEHRSRSTTRHSCCNLRV